MEAIEKIEKSVTWKNIEMYLIFKKTLIKRYHLHTSPDKNTFTGILILSSRFACLMKYTKIFINLDIAINVNMLFYLQYAWSDGIDPLN